MGVRHSSLLLPVKISPFVFFVPSCEISFILFHFAASREPFPPSACPIPPPRQRRRRAFPRYIPAYLITWSSRVHICRSGPALCTSICVAESWWKKVRSSPLIDQLSRPIYLMSIAVAQEFRMRRVFPIERPRDFSVCPNGIPPECKPILLDDCMQGFQSDGGG